MSERRRAALSRRGVERWANKSEEAKQEIRDRGRRQWQALSDEQKAEIRAKQEATRNARYPNRPAQYAAFNRARAAGEVVAKPCPGCGGQGSSELLFDDEHDDPTAWRVIGWRCYPCRKAVSDV